MNRPAYTWYTVIPLWALVLLTGCRKFLTVSHPPGGPDTEQLFQSESSARGVLSGIYSEMTAPGVFSSSLATLYGGLAADELYRYTPGLADEIGENRITPAAHDLLSSGVWQPAYRFIYTTNVVLQKLPAAASLSGDVKRELTGEACFVRAFCYLQLVNAFGGVPLVLSPDFHQSQRLPRALRAEVYAQVLKDLWQAENCLPSAVAPQRRARPTRQAATALRARVHGYLGQWQATGEAAGEVIGSGMFQLALAPEAVFVHRSPETIFYLEVPSSRRMNAEAAAVVPLSGTTLPTYLLRPGLLDAFEPGDRRRSAWTGERTYSGLRLHYPAKYQGSSNTRDESDYVVLRLAEQYLVRAEARIQLGDVSGARDDLNVLRARAGLPPLSTTGADALRQDLAQERRTELAFEWGHRWNDLRRTGKAGFVLGPLKGIHWQSTDTLWPVPDDQLRLNPALTQNPGY